MKQSGKARVVFAGVAEFPRRNSASHAVSDASRAIPRVFAEAQRLRWRS